MDLEFKVPGIIFGVSLAVLIGWACIYPAQGSIGIALLAVTLSLGVNVILGVVALFVAAALFNMSFGELRSAYLKLAQSSQLLPQPRQLFRTPPLVGLCHLASILACFHGSSILMGRTSLFPQSC